MSARQRGRGIMPTPRLRCAVAWVLLALVCVAAAPAWSQAYPARSVKLVTQGAAGTGSDVVARLVIDQLARMWGQQIVILNHPGAGGSAAARVAAAAAPDGYTLYVAATSTFIAMHEMFPNLPFSIDRDFTRIGLMGELPMMLAVPPSLGVTTLAELVALSKTRPILYAGNARGTFANLTVERLRQETGADFSFVPYPGATAALRDLLGGRISMMCEAPSAFLGPVQAGSVKLLAIGSPKRLPNSRCADDRRNRPGLHRHGLACVAGADRNAGADHPQGQCRPQSRLRPARDCS